MATETQTAEVYTCDNEKCRTRHIVTDESPPEGFHGSVARITDTGCNGTHDYYACKPSCIRNAVIAATDHDEGGGPHIQETAGRRGYSEPPSSADSRRAQQMNTLRQRLADKQAAKEESESPTAAYDGYGDDDPHRA